MGAAISAGIGAAADISVAGAQTSASIANTNATNKANRDIAQMTNESNERNVAATNKANLDIAQMNNEYNARALDKQIKTQWDMWNAENAYNDPSAQMKRFGDAGINPYMAMGAINNGNASSMISPSPAPADTSGTQIPAQAQMGAPMQTTDFSGLQGFSDAVKTFVSLANAEKDAKGKDLDNMSKEVNLAYQETMLKANLSKILMDNRYTKSKIKGQDIENLFKPGMLSSELQMRNTQNMYTKIQAHGQMIANLNALEWYKVLPQQIRQSITEQMVRINNMKLSGKLTSKQVETEVGKAMNEQMKYLQGSQSLEAGDVAIEGAKKDNLIKDDEWNKIKWEVTKLINNSGPDGAYGIPNLLYGTARNIGELF